MVRGDDSASKVINSDCIPILDNLDARARGTMAHGVGVCRDTGIYTYKDFFIGHGIC